jgi:hypothetical protein
MQDTQAPWLTSRTVGSIDSRRRSTTQTSTYTCKSGLTLSAFERHQRSSAFADYQRRLYGLLARDS